VCGLQYFHNLAAAVCALIFCDGELALIVRGQDPGRGRLDLPGGFVDPGEDLETAVLREVREELALTLPPPRYLFSVPNTYHYQEVDYWTLDAMFMFSLGAKPAFVPNAEALALQWRPLPAIAPEALAFESVRVALARLREEGFPGG
jgi:ADP-ribose pyrophosphatase YjhB (NUDIX family)